MTRSILTLFFLMFGSLSVAQTGNDWLLGTWWYAAADGEIVQGEEKDGMRFAADGSVDLIDGSGEAYLSCRYTLGDRLLVDCEIRGKPRRLTFRIDGDRTRLANVEDDDDGHYRRED